MPGQGLFCVLTLDAKLLSEGQDANWKLSKVAPDFQSTSDFHAWFSSLSDEDPIKQILLEDISAHGGGSHAYLLVPGQYRGLDRYDARARIIEDLQACDLVEDIKKHKLQVPRGERTHAVIEPMLTDQWFVNMDGLAKRGLNVVENGELKFVPENWTSTYNQWLENIHRRGKGDLRSLRGGGHAPELGDRVRSEGGSLWRTIRRRAACPQTPRSPRPGPVPGRGGSGPSTRSSYLWTRARVRAALGRTRHLGVEVDSGPRHGPCAQTFVSSLSPGTSGVGMFGLPAIRCRGRSFRARGHRRRREYALAVHHATRKTQRIPGRPRPARAVENAKSKPEP